MSNPLNVILYDLVMQFSHSISQTVEHCTETNQAQLDLRMNKKTWCESCAQRWNILLCFSPYSRKTVEQSKGITTWSFILGTLWLFIRLNEVEWDPFKCSTPFPDPSSKTQHAIKQTMGLIYTVIKAAAQLRARHEETCVTHTSIATTPVRSRPRKSCRDHLPHERTQRQEINER